MTEHATPPVVADLLKHVIRITQREVIHPALQVSVEFRDELVDGHKPEAARGHRRQCRPFPAQRFHRRPPVQIPGRAAETATLVSELVTQKVQMRSWLVQ